MNEGWQPRAHAPNCTAMSAMSILRNASVIWKHTVGMSLTFMDVSDVKSFEEQRNWINCVTCEIVFQPSHPDTDAPVHAKNHDEVMVVAPIRMVWRIYLSAGSQTETSSLSLPNMSIAPRSFIPAKFHWQRGLRNPRHFFPELHKV